MSSSAESRIVTMQFNNSQFERGAQQSMSTLQKLKSAMSFDGLQAGFSKVSSGISGIFSRFKKTGNPLASAQAGVNDLQKSTSGFNTSQITGGVSSISKSFVAMSTVAITAIANITNRIVDAGLNWAKSFTFSPIMDGLHEYETNLKSIQTVQANTDRPLPEINAALQQLNKYSDQTIYNFSEMARNVGTFTAAGVDLKTSVSSIKGIANLAALSGSSSQQAATAMYQLSQAISSGKVGLQDWNSVVNAGMGGKKLQNALAQTAIAMGDIDAKSVKMVGPMKKLTINGQSFRESIMAKPGETPWLSSDILVNTLATMDGRFSHAALAAEKTTSGLRKYSDAQIEAKIQTARTTLEQKNGVKYTDEQFKALQKMSTMAFKSATEVKTLGQVFDVAKETIGSGWSASFQNIFGNLTEAKKLFTGMSQGLNNIINQNALARNTVLNAWKKGGGRDTLITALSDAWTAFTKVIGTVHDAFRDIFPAKTGQDLINMTNSFADFTKGLIPGKDTLDLIGRTARGVFAIFSIGISIIKGIAGVIGDLFGYLTAGQGSFLNITAGVGDFLVALDQAIKKGGLLTGFFSGLTAVLKVPITIIKNLASAIGSIFSGFDTKALDGLGQRFSPIEAAVQRVQSVLAGLSGFFGDLAGKAVEAFSGIGDAIANAFTADTFGQALDVINTALLGGIVLALKNFMNGSATIDIGGGLFSQIKESLGGVTDALSTMQTNLKANILLKIAGAVAILAASLLVLSTIDPKRLASALTGMAASFVIMQVAITKLVATVGLFGSLKLAVISASLMALATAILILAAAVKVFASMDMPTMLRGLTGVALTLLLLTKATGPMSANASGMVRAGAGLLILAFALKVMAGVVAQFAAMDLKTTATGLAGVAGTLLVLAAAMRVMPKGILLQAAALLVLGAALQVIGSAVSSLGNMDVGTLVQGIAGIGAALGIIALAMQLMPGPTLLIQAAALVVLAGALTVIGLAVAQMGGMSIEQVATGLGTLAGALLILSAGLYAMSGSLLGAAALLAAAAALAVMVPVLVTLGSLDISTIVTALAALAGVFLVLAVGGLALAALTPVLIGLGAAMVLFGAGLALAGAGALAFATAFGIVVAAGSAGVAILSAILGKIISSIPKALKAFGQGIVQFAGAIAKGAPQFFRAFGAILNSLIKAAMQAIPKIGALFMQLMNTALRIVVSLTPRIVAAGLRMIVQFLAAISKNVPKIVKIAADIVVKFLNGIANNIGRIIQAGVNLIIKFIEGCTRAINNNSAEMGRAGADLAVAVANGMIQGLGAAVGRIAQAAADMAKAALGAAKKFLGINSPSKEFAKVGAYSGDGLVVGLKTSSRTVSRAGEGLGKAALAGMKATMTGVAAGIPSMMEIRPTITPVLDLSEAKRNASGLSSILDKNRIRADISARGAASVSSELAAAAAAMAEAKGPEAGTRQIALTQINNSPKALPAAEIYRNTKGLLALTKEALESNESN